MPATNAPKEAQPKPKPKRAPRKTAPEKRDGEQ